MVQSGINGCLVNGVCAELLFSFNIYLELNWEHKLIVGVLCAAGLPVLINRDMCTVASLSWQQIILDLSLQYFIFCLSKLSIDLAICCLRQ